MPTKFKDFPASVQMGSRFEKYLDGAVWSFTASEVKKIGFEDLAKFQKSFHSCCAQKNIQAITRRWKGCIYIQATRKNLL